MLQSSSMGSIRVRIWTASVQGDDLDRNGLHELGCTLQTDGGIVLPAWNKCCCAKSCRIYPPALLCGGDRVATATPRTQRPPAAPSRPSPAQRPSLILITHYCRRMWEEDKECDVSAPGGGRTQPLAAPYPAPRRSGARRACRAYRASSKYLDGCCCCCVRCRSA